MDEHNLAERQKLSLKSKITMSQTRIRQWYDHFDGDVYVSFSGGKDSTVLLDLIRNTPGVYDIPAVFVDTGLEYPEVRNHATKYADVVLKPDKTFKEVIEHYGYPVVSKEQALYLRQIQTTKSESLRYHRLNGFPPNGRFCVSKKWLYLAEAPFKISEKCCDVMKKRPFHKYEKETQNKPYIGTMASESRLRQQGYTQHGCNAFDLKRPMSTPLGFWTEQDVLEYIKLHKLEYPSVYGEIVGQEGHLSLTGVNRTGCMFCMFGVHLDPEPNRFQQMEKTHPKQYKYCMEKLGLGEILDYLGVPYENNQLTLFD